MPHSPSGLIRSSGGDSLGCDSVLASTSTSPTVLKRKRPARLDIPIVSMGFGNIPATPFAGSAREREEMFEVEGDGYAVYCKKGRREAMEDRYSAVVDLQGESKQVVTTLFSILPFISAEILCFISLEIEIAVCFGTLVEN